MTHDKTHHQLIHQSDKSLTTHILKTLRQHSTVTIPSTSASTPLCTIPKTPLPTIPHHPFTTTSNPKPTPFKETILPSEYFPFSFYFIPNLPNDISKLNLPMNLARHGTEIQRNTELYIIKIMEDYLMKQNKHRNVNKTKTRNNKVLNCKPRFTPREHKPTSPIHTFPATDTTTDSQNAQTRFKKHTSNITTQYTQPTHKNQAYSCTNLQLLPQYTTAFHCQPNTHHKSVNRFLRIYCRNMDVRFVENINPGKHLSCSGLHLNHLGTPILTVNFLNVLNSLDSEQ